jgi:hypothetical protein
VLDHAAPSRQTQLCAVKLERELLALFSKHLKPTPPGVRRRVHQLVSAETARVERYARPA